MAAEAKAGMPAVAEFAARMNRTPMAAVDRAGAPAAAVSAVSVWRCPRNRLPNVGTPAAAGTAEITPAMPIRSCGRTGWPAVSALAARDMALAKRRAGERSGARRGRICHQNGLHGHGRAGQGWRTGRCGVAQQRVTLAKRRLPKRRRSGGRWHRRDLTRQAQRQLRQDRGQGRKDVSGEAVALAKRAAGESWYPGGNWLRHAIGNTHQRGRTESRNPGCNIGGSQHPTKRGHPQDRETRREGIRRQDLAERRRPEGWCRTNPRTADKHMLLRKRAKGDGGRDTIDRDRRHDPGLAHDGRGESWRAAGSRKPDQEHAFAPARRCQRGALRQLQRLPTG